MCSHLLVHILPHIQTYLRYTKYRMIPHLGPSTPKTLFPLHLSFQMSQGISFTLKLFFCQSLGNSSLPFSLIICISTVHRKMSWPEERKNWGLLNKGLRKELGVTNKQRFWLGCSHNKAFHFLWQYFCDTTLTWKKKSNSYTFPVSSKLTLPGAGQEILTEQRMWKRSVGLKENIFTSIFSTSQHTKKNIKLWSEILTLQVEV